MLKACCECVGSALGVQESEAYGQQSNGVTQLTQPIPPSPPWPEPRPNEIMFVLPRSLQLNDKITVSGTLRSNRSALSVSLVTADRTLQPDYNNIACQLIAKFPNEMSEQNEIKLRLIQDGLPVNTSGENLATDLFTDLNFNFVFEFYASTGFNGGTLIAVLVGTSFLNEIELKHNLADIRFLSLTGDVERVSDLNFKFS